MSDVIDILLQHLKRVGHDAPQPASPESLKEAEEAGFPPELLSFYARCEPDEFIELKQRIWSIENAIVENENAVPGCALSPHGYVVFASNLCDLSPVNESTVCERLPAQEG